MPATSMQSRLTALVSGMAVPPLALENMALITPDLQPCPMPDLSTVGGQMMLEPFLKGVDMVVLDNIATLCRTGKENESQSDHAGPAAGPAPQRNHRSAYPPCREIRRPARH